MIRGPKVVNLRAKTKFWLGQLIIEIMAYVFVLQHFLWVAFLPDMFVDGNLRPPPSNIKPSLLLFSCDQFVFMLFCNNVINALHFKLKIKICSLNNNRKSTSLEKISEKLHEMKMKNQLVRIYRFQQGFTYLLYTILVVLFACFVRSIL